MPQQSNSRPVYVTGIGRIPICSRCGEAKSDCRCATEIANQRPADGFVRIARDKKNRGGKTVTVITGVSGSPDEIEALAKALKKLCACGGGVHDGSIEIQGDHRDRIEAHLRAQGHKVKRVGG
jgi:translation initiation factor 1